MNRNAEFLLCADQNRAKLELRAPSARFTSPLRIPYWRSKFP